MNQSPTKSKPYNMRRRAICRPRPRGDKRDQLFVLPPRKNSSQLAQDFTCAKNEHTTRRDALFSWTPPARATPTKTEGGKPGQRFNRQGQKKTPGMLPVGSCMTSMFYFKDMFPGLNLYLADHVQHLITAGYDLLIYIYDICR